MFTYKGNGHSEEKNTPEKQVWHVSMNDGNILDAIASSRSADARMIET